MKTVNFNIDVNDYPRKEDFQNTVRGLMNDLESIIPHIENQNKERSQIQFSLTYFNEESGFYVIIFIIQKELDKKELVKLLFKGFNISQSDTINSWLEVSTKGVEIKTSDNSKMMIERRDYRYF
jgi:hypothetical protein